MRGLALQPHSPPISCLIPSSTGMLCTVVGHIIGKWRQIIRLGGFKRRLRRLPRRAALLQQVIIEIGFSIHGAIAYAHTERAFIRPKITRQGLVRDTQAKAR